MAGSGKPAFLHALFLKTKNKTAEKITRQSEICKNLAHLGAKKSALEVTGGPPSIDFYGGRGSWEYCFTFYMSEYVFLLDMVCNFNIIFLVNS